VVLCVTSTGIAALLLPEGSTSYSRFRILLVLNEISTSSIQKNSKITEDLKRTRLIIWDKVPIQNKGCFEVVHCLLVDLNLTIDNILFSGIPIILGGDFA
jgi:hypothetical protein